jgi:hypothetical protein
MRLQIVQCTIPNLFEGRTLAAHGCSFVTKGRAKLVIFKLKTRPLFDLVNIQLLNNITLPSHHIILAINGIVYLFGRASNGSCQ